MHCCIFLLLVLQTICSTTCHFPVHEAQSDVWASEYKEIIGQDGDTCVAPCANGETCCGSAVGCAAPCPSQFDAVPCDQAPDLVTSSAITQGIWDNVGKVIYRVTRPTELTTMSGKLFPKNFNMQKTLDSHVGCGSRPGYQSQFISTTTSLDVAMKYFNRSPRGARIVELKEEDVLANTDNVFDLTTPEQRDQLLNYQRAKGFAKNSKEVVLEPKEEGIPVTTIKGPKE